MIGKELEELSSMGEGDDKNAEAGEIFYEAEGLSSSETYPFNFNIRKGEVNGFTGLLGSGRVSGQFSVPTKLVAAALR